MLKGKAAAFLRSGRLSLRLHGCDCLQQLWLAVRPKAAIVGDLEPGDRVHQQVRPASNSLHASHASGGLLPGAHRWVPEFMCWMMKVNWLLEPSLLADAARTKRGNTSPRQLDPRPSALPAALAAQPVLRVGQPGVRPDRPGPAQLHSVEFARAVADLASGDAPARRLDDVPRRLPDVGAGGLRHGRLVRVVAWAR
ncbi:hypothetical protein [Azospirillum sp.]|uniref:hypothetical protein n=1 Tax=Azospirillum sp. TaxID=34012 RepID=UPI003D7582E8